MWTLVTGGARRLGAAICLALAEKGRSIVVHYHQSEEDANEIVEKCLAMGVQAESIQGDFSTLPQLEDFIHRYLERFPETTTLINNVGNYLIRSASKTTIEEWMSLFQVNLNTPFLLSKALIPSLIRHQGQIINIGVSGLNRHSANTYATAYYLTKGALWGLTLSLARELAPDQVKVNMISPGQLDISIDTHQIPMKRPGYCWEVCRMVNFLLEPQSQYITGQNIEVAGGLGLA